MMQKLSSAALVFSLVMAAAAPAAAANKEHQQLMADIRMLQEQSQQLQNLLAALNESLKAVNARIDQQTEANRKALADQKLVVDNLSNDVRVIREKLDDNNVRVGSLTQEVEALRQGIQQAAAARAAAAATTAPDADPNAAPAAGATPQPPPSPVPVGESPMKLYNAAYADYTAGQYDLAIIGYQEFIKAFPKAELADDAQVAICNSYLNGGKNQEAADACDVAIRTYPGANAIPQAYYKKGLALSNLRDVAGARDAWETLIKDFPDSAEANLAKQRLDQLKRP